MHISKKQRSLVFLALSLTAFAVWQYFVYYAAKDPVPAGMCVSVGYGSCAPATRLWGDIVWGSMGLLMILAPAWIMAVTAIVITRFMNSKRRQHQ